MADEEIPGYMEAMTIALEGKNPALLRNLQVGDEVGFQLVVTEDDSWISRIDAEELREPIEQDGADLDLRDRHSRAN